MGAIGNAAVERLVDVDKFVEAQQCVAEGVQGLIPGIRLFPEQLPLLIDEGGHALYFLWFRQPAQSKLVGLADDRFVAGGFRGHDSLEKFCGEVLDEGGVHDGERLRGHGGVATVPNALIWLRGIEHGHEGNQFTSLHPQVNTAAAAFIVALGRAIYFGIEFASKLQQGIANGLRFQSARGTAGPEMVVGIESGGGIDFSRLFVN